MEIFGEIDGYFRDARFWSGIVNAELGLNCAGDTGSNSQTTQTRKGFGMRRMQSPRKLLREMTRCRLGGGSGLTLSLPVIHDARPLMISGHGRWRQVHLNALQAVYGRTPFYPHLMPEIQELYDVEPPFPLEQFLRAGRSIIERRLGLPEIIGSIREMHERNPELLCRLGREMRENMDCDKWILDSLFRFGPRCLFGLVGVSPNISDNE